MARNSPVLSMGGRFAVACLLLVGGFLAYWATLVAGLSSHYPWLDEMPDEALLPAAFGAGVLITLGIGRLARKGVAGYVGGCLVVIICAAVFVLAPDQLG